MYVYMQIRKGPIAKKELCVGSALNASSHLLLQRYRRHRILKNLGHMPGRQITRLYPCSKYLGFYRIVSSLLYDKLGNWRFL